MSTEVGTPKAPEKSIELVRCPVNRCNFQAPSEEGIRIMRVQVEMVRLGYYCGHIGAPMDCMLEDALLHFQEANNLPQTGRIDDSTIEKLEIKY